ncbi:hypothetical protein LPMP_290760 [Leishmania panamensis]|uniref:Transmembrane protein n=3 Tax=Viannia TaxID=37616 RepID=A4HH84_LEIBR|nr:conserved hypothetical protein [Leishmania braziliensis MHOM/BR/75/M2904]XP_010700684.1 hypothetical protein LPMP_290760 [Leishmania panamensis]KAI5684926.1 hypothetical protein MNV84_05535 [Leishmania braziliensis]AIO00027.1 hypothetical protein LPMP_290760 [Leishmania panamensis]CAJ2476406.1 unnamed protein product [Leishmania braziliensis]CAM39935.1 conserved hypothetical protein [Leishmania braziliensis MHOM/BR/75/M2904]SYZ67597.1 hypothetical_protein [Leishmania braziliensis MHOM/BR/7
MPRSNSGADLRASSAGDAVKSAQGTTSRVQELFRAGRRNPEKELGIPLNELERRQSKARKTRQFVSENTSRTFDVKSSTRAQQIMNRGIDKYQREKRQRDLRSNLSMLRKLQVVLCVFGAGFFGWLSMAYLLPHYFAVQDRHRRMQLRYERAQQSLEGISDSDAAAAAGSASGRAAVPPVGPVVRVFRVEDGGEGAMRHTIQ